MLLAVRMRAVQTGLGLIVVRPTPKGDMLQETEPSSIKPRDEVVHWTQEYSAEADQDHWLTRASVCLLYG